MNSHGYYSCRAATNEGRARCPDRALQDGFCREHRGGAPLAPLPTIALVKFELLSPWTAEFERAGIPAYAERPPERTEELRAEREQKARELGRNPFEVRGRKRQGARVADTGTPVFGRWCLQRVSVFDLFRAELQGFTLSKTCRMRPGLILEFARNKEEAPRFPWDLFERFTQATFGQVDVWANESEPQRGVVHTVNCFGRSEKWTAGLRLRFNEGEWGAEAL